MRSLFRPRWSKLGAALLLMVIVAGCTPSPGESWPGLSTDGKYVYVADKDLVFRVDASLPVPTIDWLASTPNGTHVYTPPALGPDGTVYVGAYDHGLYAFSPYVNPSGAAQPSWQPTKGGEKYLGGALVSNGLVYVGQGDKGVKAYDAKTGADRLSFPDTAYGIWSAPLLDAPTNTIYIGSLDHFVYALDAKTLTKKWSVDLGGAVAGTPMLDNGILYAGSFNSELVAIDVSTQKITKRFAAHGWVWSSPVIQDGILYFGDMAGYIYALNATGDWSGATPSALKWSVKDADHDGGIRGKVAVTKDRVLAGSESTYITAYNITDGGKVWTNKANDKILSDLIVINGNVIYTTLADSQMLAANNIETNGQFSWMIARPSNDELSSFGSATPHSPTVAPTAGAATSAATLAATQSAQ